VGIQFAKPIIPGARQV